MPLTRHGRKRVLRGGLTLAAVALLAAALAVGPSLASSKATAYYPGTTSQPGKTMQLQVEKHKVIVNFFQFSSPPCGGPGGTQYAGISSKLKPNGKFKAPSPGGTGNGFVKGKVKGKNASGTAHHTLPESGCDSGEVTWTAHKE